MLGKFQNKDQKLFFEKKEEKIRAVNRSFKDF